jgi:serine-type D-Ala-D-Ala carboxypeptidase/endopeptidase
MHGSIMKRAVIAAVLGLWLASTGAAAAQDAANGIATVPWSIPSDVEIKQILVDRIDARHQSVGIVVGVIDPTGRRIVSYGHLDEGDPRPLNGDTVFEIGSITKVFTSLLLADMMLRGELALDDPVGKHLPASVTMPTRGGQQITLIDLATHRSSLPRLPDNFSPKDTANPYADYTVEQLYEFLNTYTLTRDVGVRHQYSNLGGGLLGHVLAHRAGMDFEALVRQRITGPLGMKDTAIALSPDMKARLAVGHDGRMKQAKNWDIPTLAGAVALRSTANDLLRLLAAELGFVDTKLKSAMAAQLAVRRPGAAAGTEIALGWYVSEIQTTTVIRHNGITGGYRSYIAFDPRARTGVVVLSNAYTRTGPDDIGRHVLAGAPLRDF